MVVGLIKPDDGQVFLDKEEITKMPMYKRAQLGIGYLPQEASVFRSMSVEDNIKAILEMTNLRRSEQKEKLERCSMSSGCTMFERIKAIALVEENVVELK